MDGTTLVLLATVACLSVYVIGVGGATAAALRIREAWRHRRIDIETLRPQAGHEVVLSAPALSSTARVLRVLGWFAFGPALVLALFANSNHGWLIPLTLVVTVALNAFYFTAMQTMGEQLMLNEEEFQTGTGGRTRSVRWIHVTDLEGARVGAFSAMRMSEPGEWDDPRARPNVILYRLNRALVATNKNFLQRLTGLSYYDGVIRNAFGVPTDQLLEAMRMWRQIALDASDLPLTRHGRHQKPRDHHAADGTGDSTAGHPGEQKDGKAAPHQRRERSHRPKS
jgi:hypothetical protein